MAAPKPSTHNAPATLVQLAAHIAALPQGTQYPSMAALVVAAHPFTPRTLATQARGVLRNTNQGVGRGRRYGGFTPRSWAQAYSAVQAQRTRSKATAQAGKASSKAKGKQPAKATA